MRRPLCRARSLTRTAVALVGAALALTIGCSGDSALSPSPSDQVQTAPASIPIVLNGRLEATVDGSPWVTPAMATVYHPVSFVLTASRSPGPDALLGMAAPLAVGSKSVELGSLSFYLVNNLNFADSWQAGALYPGSSGTLTLSAATDGRVAGTFAFTAVARTPGLTPTTRSVVSGSFVVSR